MEYVRCRMHVRRVIGRLEPDPYTRISLGRGSTGSKSRFVFRTWSDTHGCVYRKGFIRTHSFRRSQCRRTKTYEKEKKHGSNQQELIDKAAETIVEAAKRTDAKVSGPIPLPTKTEIVTILRAVHKYKDSREQFERRTHKRLIDIMSPSQKTVEALMSVEVPAGVEIEIKL